MSAADTAHPPRIGLSSYRSNAAWGVWNEPADLLPASYADAVILGGGAPVLLPSPPLELSLAGPSRSALATAILDGVDGLLLTGGPDLDPDRYGAARNPNTQPPRPERDEWEIALTHLALDRGLPLLCICRGLQTLNVTLGGTLIQHLPDVVGHDAHSPTVGVHGRHRISTAPGSRIAAIYGPGAEVATYHHQAVDHLADGLVPTAWADDQIIEAAESSGASWVVAVQWHPEVVNGEQLFVDFVNQCRIYRGARR